MTPRAPSAHDFAAGPLQDEAAGQGEAHIIRRRGFLGFAMLSLAGPLARAQPPRTARVGVLAGTGDLVYRETFVDALRALGWSEVGNLLIDWRATPRQEEVPALAADMIRQKPDAIVTGGPRTTLEVAKITTALPIVFIAVGDPVRLGVVRSLTQPGGNVTGFQTFPGDDYLGKLLQLLKEAAPRISRVGILFVPANAMHRALPDGAKASAAKLALAATAFAVSDASGLEPAFEQAGREGVDALLVPGDILFSAKRERIAALALKHRLPSIFMFPYYAEAGGLMSYGVSVSGMYRNAARQVNRILRGARPQDLPVERADTFELVVNQRTAKQLGLQLPDSLRVQATRVIE